MFKVLSSGAVERYAGWKGVVGFETVAMAAQVWVPRRASVGATSMRPSRLANMPLEQHSPVPVAAPFEVPRKPRKLIIPSH